MITNADVLMAARDRHAIPEGVALDRVGESTVDPSAVLDGGALLPFGGHKGSAIAVMVELLAAALTGARFGFEDEAARHPGATTANTGQLILLIDPKAAGGGNAARRAEELLASILDAGATRLPGARREAARADIPVMKAMLQQLESWVEGQE